MQEAHLTAHGGRHYATEVREPNNAALRQQWRITVDDVTDIDDCMGYNVCACLCCCWPLGLVGIMFSIACDSAKSKGNKADATRG